MGKNGKGGKKPSSGPKIAQKQTPNSNARDSDSRREQMRRRLQMKHRERHVDAESPESILALALSYANGGKVAKACETFAKVPKELLDDHRERYACLLLDNEEADLAREQLELSKNTSQLHQTVNLFTLALIEYIASHHLEESSHEDAEKALKKAFAFNPFVAEAIVWDSFDEILNDDNIIEKMPESDKMEAEEAAIAYLICWGQLEIWEDSGANEWILEKIWGGGNDDDDDEEDKLPTFPAPKSERLQKRWIEARNVAMEEWMNAHDDDNNDEEMKNNSEEE